MIVGAPRVFQANARVHVRFHVPGQRGGYGHRPGVIVHRRGTAKDARAAGLDIVTWTLERSGVLADGSNGFYDQTVESAVSREGDTFQVLDVLARQVGVLGIFSDWPAMPTAWCDASDDHCHITVTKPEYCGDRLRETLPEPQMLFFDLFRDDPNLITVNAGEFLFDEGEPGSLMYVLVTGRADVLRGARLIERMTVGDVVGEIGLLEPGERLAAVRADTDCQFACIDLERMDMLVARSGAFAMHVMRVMARRHREIFRLIGPANASSGS